MFPFAKKQTHLLNYTELRFAVPWHPCFGEPVFTSIPPCNLGMAASAWDFLRTW
jgi:hypothetical protein